MPHRHGCTLIWRRYFLNGVLSSQVTLVWVKLTKTNRHSWILRFKILPVCILLLVVMVAILRQVSLYNPGWPGNHYENQAGLELNLWTRLVWNPILKARKAWGLYSYFRLLSERLQMCHYAWSSFHIYFCPCILSARLQMCATTPSYYFTFISWLF